MDYKTEQKKRQINFFPEEKRNGEYNGKNVKHVLKVPADNFYEGIYDDTFQYFKDNKILWWRGTPTGNTISSQVACINHLFPIRKDKEAVLTIAKQIDTDINNVVELENDEKGTRGFISFEVVSKEDHLKETNSKPLTRGSNCTSIDAVIMAEKNGKRCLLVIEWKYTEYYGNKSKLEGESGETRLKSYKELLENSDYINKISNYEESVIFHEPFYQLMRQTLWAEQMVKNKNVEILKADAFIHVHVVPEGNKQLLEKKYINNNNLEITWNGCLKDKGQNCYKLITPKSLFDGLKNYDNLKEYLSKRYWQ